MTEIHVNKELFPYCYRQDHIIRYFHPIIKYKLYVLDIILFLFFLGINIKKCCHPIIDADKNILSKTNRLINKLK